jgi:hypothetical protein
MGGALEFKNAYGTLIEKPDGKRLFGRPKHRWKKEIRCDDVGWIQRSGQ